MKDVTEQLILKELQEIKTGLKDVNKRLDATNERIDATNERIDATNERIDETNKRLDETNKRLDETNKRLDETNERIDATNARVTSLEEGRVKDRKDILAILDTMQQSISNQFVEMREYIDAKFEKIFEYQRKNDLEHEEFKKILYTYNKRLDFHNARLNYLEHWKQDLDRGEYTMV